MFKYDAFISYSHAKDIPVARALQGVIQSLGRKWWQRRAMRVFRDDSSLAASPHLWPDIQKALDQSRYLIVLASPEAAASSWVGKEVEHWLATKGSDTVLIALTAGTMTWDSSAGDFRWKAPSPLPLPLPLKGRFTHEPKWVDLTPFRESGDASRKNTEFINRAADIAATVQGIAKEDLISEELAQQRRALRTAYAAAAGLAVLATGAAFEAWQATLAKNRAELVLEQGTASANKLVSELAQRFRGRTNIRQDLVIGLLDEAHDLVQGLSKASGKKPEPQLERSQGYALVELSKSYRTQGDAGKAQRSAEEAIAIFDKMSKTRKLKIEWRDGLATGFDRLGDALADMNKTSEAAAAYDKSRAVLESSAVAHGKTSDNAASTARRNLAVAFEKQGDVLLAQGQAAEGLAALRKSLELRKELVAANRDKPEFERDEEVSRVKIAEAHAAAGDSAQAQAEFEAALVIAEKLAATSPDNLEPQRDLLVIRRGSADLAHKLGDEPKAQEHLLAALPIAETLAAADPDRMEWQDDVISIADRIGDRLVQEKRYAEAASYFERNLTGSKRRIAKDPARGDWQRGLAVAYKKTGDSLRGAGRPGEAVAAYKEALAIRRKITPDATRRTEFDAEMSQNFQVICNALVEDKKPKDALAVALERVVWFQNAGTSATAETRAAALGSQAWYALLAQDPDGALKAADAASALAPDQLWLRANRAHALMYSNRLNAAREEYLGHKGKIATGKQNWQAYIAGDFADLRKAGLDHALMEEIEADLK
jgi:tetratricopeptide (TPR) repeat protein